MAAEEEPVVATCHCGQVEIVLAKTPDVVVECNCSLCTKYGVLWTYYEASDILGMPEGSITDSYAWNGENVDFHRCSNCGCITHWMPRSASRSRRGINARLLPKTLLASARLRHRDGAETGKYLD
ncbi:GFA family protein [Devosia sp. YIM 151766]|uniref:GFA family protein n=1 Tax=Devosia sp. YIM 151766 TaxID=3017325 RepID=UPI00255C7829|nr:GFA family protein [Devosia sp. YIM 151766]WIY54022.1 GFA family protein [Devosia sp. YIM 151766]